MPRRLGHLLSTPSLSYKRTFLFTINYFYPPRGELVRELTSSIGHKIESSQEQENGTRWPWPRAWSLAFWSRSLFGGTQQEPAIEKMGSQLLSFVFRVIIRCL